MSELTLNVASGAKLVPIIDADGERIGSFRFNPTDTNILYRYKAVVEFFESYFKDRPEEPEDTTDEERVERLLDVQQHVNEQIDALLGYEAHVSIFEKCGALSITENGDFFFEQIIEGIAKLIEQATKQRVKKIEKIRKATSRYQKK